MHETNEDQFTEEIQSRMIYELSKTLKLFHLTSSESMLLATLYLNEEPMTLDEMALALGKSKTSMSTGIRSLLEDNLVERVWKKGKRKDYFQVNDKLYDKIMKSFFDKWRNSVENQKSALIELEKKLSNHTNNVKVQFLSKRLQEMVEFHTQINTKFSPNK